MTEKDLEVLAKWLKLAARVEAIDVFREKCNYYTSCPKQIQWHRTGRIPSMKRINVIYRYRTRLKGEHVWKGQRR